MLNNIYDKYSVYRKKKETKRLSNKMDMFSELFKPTNTIDSQLFFKTIEEMGVNPSDNILIRLNSGFSKSYSGGIIKFYKDLFSYVDESKGNVLSLSYTFDRSPLMYLAQNKVFNKNMPTTTGLVNEIFRRLPNVERSLHPTHSVSVYGVDSEEIVSKHHLNPYTYSEVSPFNYISGQSNGKEIVVGLNHYSINQHYIEKESSSFGFIDNLVASKVKIDNKIATFPFLVDNPFKKLLCEYNTEQCVKELFNSGVLKQKYINGISIYVYDSKKHAELLINLRKQNICKFKSRYFKTFLLDNLVKPIVLKNFFNLKNDILYPKEYKGK